MPAKPDPSVFIDYTNYRGERSVRLVVPQGIIWASNEWHPEEQWLLRAYDLGKDAERYFAMSSIHSWRTPVEHRAQAKQKETAAPQSSETERAG
jgi:predicted DNA-binding transcriptional regulator YafY